ncbi:conserved membrane protein of unknown function [Kyrpidia spormannii]|uniref:Uncharacterized protein n=2 Tax=Kyrpidia spormannii TaxID=2055160 RepID=A0ACA8ZCF2_9BACL|nr:conserved membrane protein of unknown function [Kyrpidia spormannii]CAB3392727.1 conserved membrane protein of unknown function [Kyrpidia spormannii]
MPVMYGDLVAAVNAGMDALALWGTAWILRIPPRPLRVLAAACFGAGYAMAELFLPALGGWWARIVVSAAMVRLALPLRGIGYWIQAIAFFYLANFVFAGAMIALQWGVGGTAGIGAGLVVMSGTPAWLWRWRTGVLALGIPFGLLLLAGLYRVKRRNEQLVDYTARMKVVTPLGSREVPVLLDSGNQLREPLSGWPVIVAEAEGLRGILPSSLFEWLRNARGPGRDPPIAPTADLGEEWSSRLRVVAWRGVHGRGGLLPAFRPDGVQIRQGSRVWTVGQVYVAIQAEPVDRRRRYAAIVPTSVLDSAGIIAGWAGQ